MADKMLYMKMSNGDYIYGSNLDIGKYSVKFDPPLECVEEYDFKFIGKKWLK